MQKFWDWFSENATKYERSENVDQTLIGDQNREGRCFGNSQSITLKNFKLYCEGFVKSHIGFIFHGFNVDENVVEDYTIESHHEKFQDQNKKLPNEYYGIIIPNSFIHKHNGANIADNNMNISHLIELYFKSNF